jgi:iron(III) transport system ATP-binding protein
MAEKAVTLSSVTKYFGAVEVLKPIDLSFEEGSFTSLLGPSGCGKTTILNLVAGLEAPNSGSISIHDAIVHDRAANISVPAEKRNIGYVFQTYALWPHMTVLQNVAYPLKIRGIGRAERAQKAGEILHRLELGQLADRYPFQLSGGQQQRVAIARALVYRAKLLLLDEPLSNLDAQLRERARSWLADVHKEFALTTILVTHDQSEAMSLSDRVVLLSKGRVEQDGAPNAIYDMPMTAYAAEFVGNANVISGSIVEIRQTGGKNFARLDVGNGTILEGEAAGAMVAGQRAAVSIRPQRVLLASPSEVVPPEAAAIDFTVRNALYLGASFEIIGDTPIGRLRVLADRLPAGNGFKAILRRDDCRCVFTDSGA